MARCLMSSTQPRNRSDFLRAEDDGQLLRLLRRRDDLLEGPLLLERHLVEEAQRGDGDEIEAGASFLSLVR